MCRSVWSDASRHDRCGRRGVARRAPLLGPRPAAPVGMFAARHPSGSRPPRGLPRVRQRLARQPPPSARRRVAAARPYAVVRRTRRRGGSGRVFQQPASVHAPERLEFPILSGESAPPVWRQPNVDHVGSWRATAPRRPAAPSRHVCSVRCSTATRYPPNARRTEATCTRLSVLARHAAVAVERLAASGRLPVECVAVSARQTAASVAVGSARGDHWPDERVALPRGVVVYPRGAEPGLARPA